MQKHSSKRQKQNGSTRTASQAKEKETFAFYIGIDLGDKHCDVCVLDQDGEFHQSFRLRMKGADLQEQIAYYDRREEPLARTRYPKYWLLQQVDGVGVHTALSYMLTIGDAERFAKSRLVGCFPGMRPRKKDSGESQPQLGITKAGDVYLRKTLVNCAHYILGRYGRDSDLRRYGQRICARGGKNAKKRAVIAVARKLAVLLHRLWVSGEVYEPLRNSQKAVAA